VVEDELPVLKILSDILKLSPYVNLIFTAEDGEKALNIYKSNKIDVIITDVLMPKITGLELLKKIKEINSEANIIVISAYGNTENLREAIRNGAYDYIFKPFSVDEILFSVSKIIEKLKLIEERKKYVSSLENVVKKTRIDIENHFFDSLKAILNTMEVRDKSILLHCQNVSIYAEKLGKKLGIDKRNLEMICIGAVLHDIGKIGIPDNILLKKGSLDLKEFDIVKQHPLVGKKILLPIIKEGPVIDIVTYHHERFDGKGYPEGLKGKDIPLAARIISIVNAYDSMLNGTVYFPPKDFEYIKKELVSNAGKQFDPEMVKVFISMIES